MEEETEKVFIKQETIESKFKMEVLVEVEPYNEDDETKHNFVANRDTGGNTNGVIKTDDYTATIVKEEQSTSYTDDSTDDVSESTATDLDNNDDKPGRAINFEGQVYANGKRNRLKCPKCDTTFKNRANLKGHLKYIHATEDEAKECDICFRTFKSLVHLRSHANSVHMNAKEVTCDHCGKNFLNKKKLDNHIFYTHPKQEEDVLCGICPKVFKTKHRLKLHIRTVHPEGKNVNCPVCDKEFKSEMLLQRHVKWAHPPDGMTYRCQDCGRVLPSIQCFKKHLKNVHGLGNIKCEHCDKLFQTNNTLHRHVKRFHEGVVVEKKQYKSGQIDCDKCDKKFSTVTALTWHKERLHSDNKLNTSCQLCLKEFGDHNGLKRHLETVHSMETATCNICSKTFKSYLNLQRHLRVTHAPPEAAETCDICNKTFKCSMHLKIHIYAVHPKEGRVSCDICKKEFSSKKYLLKHEKTHYSKEYECTICGNFFKTRHDVNRHVRRVHTKDKIRVLERKRNDKSCLQCGLYFHDDLSLHKHIATCGFEVGSHTAFIKVEVGQSGDDVDK